MGSSINKVAEKADMGIRLFLNLFEEMVKRKEVTVDITDKEPFRTALLAHPFDRTPLAAPEKKWQVAAVHLLAALFEQAGHCLPDPSQFGQGRVGSLT
jgi:hypothetical protein